jgi:hypothetical protein
MASSLSLIVSRLEIQPKGLDGSKVSAMQTLTGFPSCKPHRPSGTTSALNPEPFHPDFDRITVGDPDPSPSTGACGVIRATPPRRR